MKYIFFLLAIIGLFLVNVDKRKHFISYNSSYLRYIWMILFIVFITFLFKCSRKDTSSVLNLMFQSIFVLNYFGLLLIDTQLYTILMSPKGHRIKFLLKVLGLGGFVNSLIFILSVLTLKILLKEMYSQFYGYRFVWIIALIIPMILVIIKYYKSKYNYLLRDSNTHDLILYLIARLDNKQLSITDKYIDDKLNKIKEVTKNNNKLLLIISLLESFGITYISIAFVMSKYVNSISDNYRLILISILISVITLVIVSILFQSINLSIHKLYDNKYQPLKVVFNNIKGILDVVKMTLILIFLIIKTILKHIKFQLSSIYEFNKLLNKVHTKTKFLEKNDINALKKLLRVDYKEHMHISLVFIYAWSISNILKMRLGMGINKRRFLKKLSNVYNIRYPKMDYAILCRINFFIQYENMNNEKFFLFNPLINWNNRDAKKYVLNKNNEFKVNNSLDKEFKTLLNKI